MWHQGRGASERATLAKNMTTVDKMSIYMAFEGLGGREAAETEESCLLSLISENYCLWVQVVQPEGEKFYKFMVKSRNLKPKNQRESLGSL